MAKKTKKYYFFEILTILLTIYVIIYNSIQDKKIDQLTFEDRAVEHKPLIELVDTPEIKLETIYFTNKNYPNYFINNPVEFGIDIKIEQIFKFVNTGSEKAMIIGKIIGDTITGEDYIRNTILNKAKFLKYGKIDSTKEFFYKQELLPGDTFIFRNNRKIGMDLKTKEFVNHFILLYENDYNILYDTYIKTKYKLNQPLFEAVFNYETGEIGFHVQKKIMWDFFKMEGNYNRTTKIYSLKERKKILKSFKTVSNK